MTFDSQTSAITDNPELEHALACMFYAPDDVHEACPAEWRTLAAFLHTFIEDEGMTTAQTAHAIHLPETTVAQYRAGVGI